MSTHAIRAAEPRDVPTIVDLIRELAQFEKLEHLCEATPQTLHPQLFGPRPAAEAVVLEVSLPDGTVQTAGFALYFTNFSTFLAKPGLWLEDLYVRPAFRGMGLGRALLDHLGALAVERGCGRFEWAVLDWNTHAIGFYRRMGAVLMDDWRICRVTGTALQAFARSGA